jgi:hypothetical protein
MKIPPPLEGKPYLGIFPKMTKCARKIKSGTVLPDPD